MAFITPFIPLIAGVASVAGSVYGGIASQQAASKQADAMREQAASQQSAAEQAEQIAYQNAANTEAETYETARREERESARIEGEQQARAAASGVTLDANTSTGLFLADSRAENKRQVDWLINAGLSRADIERWQGRLTKDRGFADAQQSRSMADVVKAQGKQALVGGIVGGIGKGLNAGAAQYSAWGTGSWDDMSPSFDW